MELIETKNTMSRIGEMAPDFEAVSNTGNIRFSDLDMKVDILQYMLQHDENETAAVRAVFITSPVGKMRLITYYPLNVGRNMDAIKRA